MEANSPKQMFSPQTCFFEILPAAKILHFEIRVISRGSFRWAQRPATTRRSPNLSWTYGRYNLSYEVIVEVNITQVSPICNASYNFHNLLPAFFFQICTDSSFE